MLFCTIVACCILHIKAASAETYNVSIRSVQPRTSFSMATCNEENKPCFLTLNLGGKENGTLAKKDYINIAMSFSEKEARFQFMQNQQYLPVKPGDGTLLTVSLDQDKKGAQRVELYDPDSLEKDKLIRHPVIRTGRRITTLEILITTVP